MYQTEQTWTWYEYFLHHDAKIDKVCSRLNERKDSTSISIITVDYLTHNYPSISRIEDLPFDCASLLSAPPLYGGVMVLASNALLHVDQTSRVTALPLNGWAHRTSALPSLITTLGDEQKIRAASLNLMLEGARMAFLSERDLLLALPNGAIHLVTVVVDGRLVQRLTIGDAIARASAPSTLQLISNGHIFVGSTVGPALLLRSSWHDLQQKGEDLQTSTMANEDIDIDEGPVELIVALWRDVHLPVSLDLYGESAYALQPTVKGTTGALTGSDGPKTLELSLMDTIPAWGNFTDFVFSINEDMVR
jgi:cleavage and polyadenylation specificity factor subunit 1